MRNDVLLKSHTRTQTLNYNKTKDALAKRIKRLRINFIHNKNKFANFLLNVLMWLFYISFFQRNPVHHVSLFKFFVLVVFAPVFVSAKTFQSVCLAYCFLYRFRFRTTRLIRSNHISHKFMRFSINVSRCCLILTA